MTDRNAHTGEHILFRALSTVFQGVSVRKVEFGKRNYFLIHYDKELEWDGILKAEQIANRIVSEGRSVRKIKGTRKEIEPRFPQLRVRWDRIREDVITVVEVERFDWAACVGDHVENTREVGCIMVTRITSVGKGDHEIEFEVGEKAQEEALKRAALASEVASVLKTSLDEVIPTVKNLKESQKTLTESVRLLTTALISRVIPDSILGVSVYVEDVSGADRKLMEKAVSALTEEGETLAVLVEQSKKVVVVAARSPSLRVDCRELLKAIIPDCRGGGKPGFALASCTQKVDTAEVKAEIKKFLEDSLEKADPMG